MQEYDNIALMRERFRGIPQRVERFRRNHPLRPPTRSEVLFIGAEAAYGAGMAAGVIYEKVTGQVPPAFDLYLGLGFVWNGVYLIDRGIERAQQWAWQRGR